MDLAQKLGIKQGQTVYVGNAPEGFALDLPDEARLAADGGSAGAVLVFVRDSSELAADAGLFGDAARRDAIAYVAYPKAGLLGTDLNRDVIWRLLSAQGIRPVRQIAVDDVWSALRFRPQ